MFVGIASNIANDTTEKQMMAANETFRGVQILIELENKEEVILLIPLVMSLLLISTIGLPGNGLVWCKIFAINKLLVVYFLSGMCQLGSVRDCYSWGSDNSFFQYHFTNSGACKTITFLKCSSLAVLIYTR